MGSDRRQANQGESQGGVRADFVASLGRKVEQARELLGIVESRPRDAEPRDELRRRLHALGTAAKMLHFDVLVRTLSEADKLLMGAGETGTVASGDLAELAQMLDDLPALAWSDTPRHQAPRSEPQPPEPKPLSRSAVLFGSEMLAEALTDEAYDGATFECERTEHVQAALGLVRSLAPDVVVIDSDVPAALELVEALLDDPLTEPVPIFVIGTFPAPEQAARYVALGVMRTIMKPISPDALRAACDEGIASREGRTMRVSLGEPTLEQLGERLADEVRRALIESVDRAGRTVRVPLGEGTEVLGAIWGAIARVREVVSSRTDGAVRFSSKGPEGAIALAPWLHQDVARGDRATTRSRGPAADVRLTGRRVVVVDDDPGVTWFIADLLRTAGCQVFEALDGQRALELAFEHSPELVVSDILMPGLDGFALCRALKRDVALRDTPVVLLSWKEDLLQRVRELGASAAAYLRKESDSRAIVARVRECLRPRARVEARIKSNGEVRGRLDGLTVHSLLELTCTIRPNARISIRDASFLYEAELRDGAPKRVTRTAGDGGFQRGAPVLAAMLGVGAGRFTVADSMANVAGDLSGSLEQQLAPALALARAAVHATTGARLMSVERVVLDRLVVDAYLRATPGPARELIAQLGEGASPRAILLSGGADPAFVEDVLADLASRGAIVGVIGAEGTDLLAPAVDRARIAMGAAQATARTFESSKPPPRTTTPENEPAPKSGTPRSGPARGPSSLTDAVMREISDRSPQPTTAAPISTSPPPLVEPSKLRPRVASNPPGEEASATDSSVDDDEPVAQYDGVVEVELSDVTDVDDAVFELKEPSIPILVETSRPSAALPKHDRVEQEATKPRQKIVAERSDRTPLSSVAGTEPLPMTKSRWTYAVVLAAAACVVWLALETRTGTAPEPRPPAGGQPTVTSAVPLPARVAEPTYVDVPADAQLAPHEGMFELSMPAEAPIRIDGTPHGRGPKLSLALGAGPHEVHVGAQANARVIEVRAGRTTRLDLPEAP